MAFKDWMIIILFIGCFTRLVINCQTTPKIVYAIDSSQAISNAEFENQRLLIETVVVDLGGNAANVAVVLYNTDVHLNITFNQFNEFSPLNKAIRRLSPMARVSRGSDLRKLFNTTFTRTPEVFLMLKKEVNSTYPEGFKVPDGNLGGVKKIAVIFEKASNIRDIADFHAVIPVVNSDKLYENREKVEDALCYALISRFRSGSTTGAATSIESYRSSVMESASIPSRGSHVFPSLSFVISLTSSSSETGMSSEHVTQQTSYTGPSFMTSVFNESYISTQPVMKEMTHTVLVSSVSHSLNLMTSFKKEIKTQVLDVASIARVTNTAQLINPVTIAPSSTVEVTVMASRTSQDREYLTKKLLEDRKFVLNFNSTHIDVENSTFLKDYFRKSASLLHFGHFLDRTVNTTRLISTSLNVLHALEKFTGMIGQAISKKNVGKFSNLEFHVGGLVSRILLVNISTFRGMQLGILDADNSSIFFPKEVFSHVIGKAKNDTGVLVSLVFDPFQVLQEPHTFDKFEDNHTVASKIVNAFTQPLPPSKLSRPVKISMKHNYKNGFPTPQCVFWDYTQRSARSLFGKWSKQGCYVFSSNKRQTECHCDHMTNYAVLMRTTEQVLRDEDERILTVLTYVGCSFSIVGVFLTAITFLSLPVIKSEITKIHLNLSIAVGVAQVLFLAAGSENLVQREVICKLYTGFLFYFFMAVFSWMFVEGVHLYQMIVIAFVSRSMIRFYFTLGWGLPACIVVIVTSIAGDGFGTLNFCWLSPVSGAIWGFVGPAVAVIGINLYVLVCVLRVRINISKKEGSKAQLRTSARVSLVLLPLLGISWFFGVLAVNDHSLVFQYIFTLSNSLQGLLIFIFHCIGNSEVRHEFQRKASHLNLIRSPTSPSSLGTARVSQFPLEEVKPNKKRQAWVGGNI